MAYKAHLVLRRNKKTGKHAADFAAKLPLKEWEDVRCLGYWHGSEISDSISFQKYWEESKAEAKRLDVAEIETMHEVPDYDR